MTQRVEDKLLYFAYGSNMYSRRLQERTPSAVVVGCAYVTGYMLSFDKLSKDGSGKCSIQETRNSSDRVYGVLFTVDINEMARLDAAEALGRGYQKIEVQTVNSNGTRTAVAYIADHVDPNLQPYDWYKELVVRGAVEHRLPAAYIRQLELVNSKPDPDAKRTARNNAIISAK